MAMSADAWLGLFTRLLEVARLGSQFPDAEKWKVLLDLLGREGPRGRPLKIARSDSGLVSTRSLVNLHRMQFVAREFFKTVRQRPSKEARAFSMAIAALELPPVNTTTARLMSGSRFVVQHEHLGVTAVRFAFIVEQGKRGPLVLGKDQLVRVPEVFSTAVRKACNAGARAAFVGLSKVEGLEVKEVVRGQLGPLVGPWDVGADAPPEVRALKGVCLSGDDAVLSVTLERLAADVAKTVTRDPWATEEAPLPGLQLARERRLFCTPSVAPRLRELAGKQVLVRC
jgi:hypothetical protein